MSAFAIADIPALRGALPGDRVLMRPFTADDITDSYIGWLRDPEVVRFSRQRFCVHTPESCHVYLASFVGSANHFLAICDRRDGATLGTLTVYRSVHHGIADIGIMVGERQVWGQGIGAEAFCLVLSALKASGAVRKVTAGTVADNRRMVSIMEKAGMKHEATRHAHELLDGVPADVVFYALFFND